MLKPAHTSVKLQLTSKALTAGLAPYLDIQVSTGTDSPSAGPDGKFGWLDKTLGSLSPGRTSVL